MISSFVDIQVVFCTLILCASGYYFIKPVAKYEKNTDKTVLITGCDSGFGKGLVISATNAGFNVIAACYSEQAAKEFDNNSDVIAVVADLTKKEDIDSAMKETDIKAPTDARNKADKLKLLIKYLQDDDDTDYLNF